jgi:hypothetical protein
VVAGDLVEIYPPALTGGDEAVVITARRLRATHQYTAQRLSQIVSKQASKKQWFGRWKRLQARKNRFLAEQKKRSRDIEHKVSRAAVEWAKERQADTLAIGEVRTISRRSACCRAGASGNTSPTRNKQKAFAPSLWTSTAPRRPVRAVAPVQTPWARISLTGTWACGAPRRGGGGQHLVAESARGLARTLPPPRAATTYRYPAWQGKRSRLDTAQVARLAEAKREAAAL